MEGLVNTKGKVRRHFLKNRPAGKHKLSREVRAFDYAAPAWDRETSQPPCFQQMQHSLLLEIICT